MKRLKRLESLLVVAGLVLLSWYAWTTVRSRLYQRSAGSSLDRTIAGHDDVPVGPAPPVVPPVDLHTGDPIGRLEIPRIHLSVVIAEGDDEKTLTLAAGHLPDTPLPWEAGNSAIAGHRDTLFRPLRNLKVNDVMQVITPHGRFDYLVTRLLVVEPSDLSVLQPTERPALTLVTCYPFAFIGAAPKRFIVQATLCDACASATVGL